MKGAVRMQRVEMREQEVLHNGRVLTKTVLDKIRNQGTMDVNIEHSTQAVEVNMEHSTPVVPMPPAKNRHGSIVKIPSGLVKKNANLIEQKKDHPTDNSQPSGSGTGKYKCKDLSPTLNNLAPKETKKNRVSTNESDDEQLFETGDEDEESENEEAPPSEEGENME